jgi:hypothetical protein
MQEYLFKILIFIVAFMLPTLGLVEASQYDVLSVNWPSYIFNVGSIMLAGIFCVGRANRFLLYTFVFNVCVSFILVMLLDMVLPYSGYLRLAVFPLVSYVGYLILIRRNQLTMYINSIKNGEGQSRTAKLLRRVIKTDLPTRETNLSLVMVSFAKVYLLIDVVFFTLSIAYYSYCGMPLDSLISEFMSTGSYFYIPEWRDMANIALDVAVSISLVTHAIYDIRRPDVIGIGNTARHYRKQKNT